MDRTCLFDASDMYEDSTAKRSVRDSTSEYDIDDDDELEDSHPLKIDLDALPEYEDGLFGSGDDAVARPSNDLAVDVQSPTRIRIKSPGSAFPRIQTSLSSHLKSNHLSSSSSAPQLSSSPSASFILSQSAKSRNRRREFAKPQLICLWTNLIRLKDNPHPSLAEKQKIAKESGLSLKQVTKWFAAARERKYLGLKSSLEGLEDFIDGKYGFGLVLAQ